MLNHKLHHIISCLHIRHFPLNIRIAHNRRRKHDCNIFCIHQILSLPVLNTTQVEHEELERVAVNWWELGESFAEMVAAPVLVIDGWCEISVYSKENMVLD